MGVEVAHVEDSIATRVQPVTAATGEPHTAPADLRGLHERDPRTSRIDLRAYYEQSAVAAENEEERGMRPAWKLWLEKDEGKVFGPGPAQLLDHVARSGSLRKAANELEMSYSKAYWTLRAMEERLGFALLTRTVGGPSGRRVHADPRGAGPPGPLPGV